MVIVYAIPVSLYCAKLRILLRHKRLEWRELPPPGGYGSSEYKKTVPSGNLPALIDGDLQIADSEAIAEYLNEKYPNPPMLPEDLKLRAKARELSRFHDTRLEPDLRVLFSFLPDGNMDNAVLAAQGNALTLKLGQLGKMLQESPYNSEDTITLGDCGFPITFAWMDSLRDTIGLEVSWPEPVRAYRKRLEKHSAVVVELEDYVPKLENWLNQKIDQ